MIARIAHWAMGWTIGSSSPGSGWEFFSSPPHPDRLWAHLSSECKGIFPGGKVATA